MLIENQSCDECQLMSGYLVRLGDARPEYVYICDDCIRRGREEIAAAIVDGKADRVTDSETKLL